jgi:hypothetical protein
MKLSSQLERVENVTCVVENQSVNVSLRIWEPENAHKSLLCIHGIAGTNSDFSVEEMLKRATCPVLMNFGKQSP